MSESNWTEEDLKFLVKHWHKLSNVEIGRRIGKTESAVRNKASKYITKDMIKKRRWSEYENDLLLKLYGTMSLTDLSKRMKRSERALQEQVKRLEGTFNTEILVEVYKTTDVAGFMGLTQSWVHRLMQKGEIPFYKINKRCIIKQCDFWEWLPNNFDKVKFKDILSEFELESPEWYKNIIKEKKRESINNKSREQWNSKEDAVLWSEMMKGTPYHIIAEQLNRGKWGVTHRASYLSKKKMKVSN